MRTVTLSALAGATCALLLAIPAGAAGKTRAETGNSKAVRSAIARTGWAPQTLSGTVSMVNTDRRLLVVEGPDHVPYDMIVTPKTLIRFGDRTLTLTDLARCQNKTVSIRYVPERRGDVARSIRFSG